MIGRIADFSDLMYIRAYTKMFRSADFNENNESDRLSFGVCLLGQAISAFLPISFPGSVLSMIILFILLFFRVIKVDHIRQKADFLLKNMSFFFIPAGIGILSSFDLIRSSILPLITVIIVTTILTF